MRRFVYFIPVLFLAGLAGLVATHADAAPAAPVIDIIGSIDGDTVAAVEKVLDDVKPGTAVTVRIDSPGGSVFAGLRVIELIQRAHVHTTCEVGGAALSMAAIVLESPACGERVVRPWSVIMFHRASTGADHANTFELRQSLAVLDTLDRALAIIVSHRVGGAPETYLAWTAVERWMTGSDAVRSNFADREQP